MKLVSLFFFLLISTIVLSQSPEKPNVQIETHSYTFGNKEIHSFFSTKLFISKSLRAELDTFYDTYLLENRMRNSITVKKKLTKNFYVLTGVSSERIIGQSLVPLNRTPRYGVINGVGYDINDNMLIEAKSDFSINNTGLGAFGEPLLLTPQVYTLVGKLKF